MGKSGVNKVKIIGKKKINRYTKEECNKELARLEAMNDRMSKYHNEIMHRKSQFA